jgi:hypothetical protein
MTASVRTGLAWCLRVLLAVIFLFVAFQLSTGQAPFLALVNQEAIWLESWIVVPLMVIGALLLLVPRTTLVGVGVLAFVSLAQGLTTLDRIPGWDLITHFNLILMFGPFLLFLYLLSYRSS